MINSNNFHIISSIKSKIIMIDEIVFLFDCISNGWIKKGKNKIIK
jgi:hypothetical protein